VEEGQSRNIFRSSQYLLLPAPQEMHFGSLVNPVRDGH
jgi:hypothetical protein